MEDDPLYQRKLGIYRLLLHVAVTNSRRDTADVFTESDTTSKSDSEPGDDDELDIHAHESWPSTSDLGNEGLEGPTSHLPGYVGRAANGLVTQPPVQQQRTMRRRRRRQLLLLDATMYRTKRRRNHQLLLVLCVTRTVRKLPEILWWKCLRFHPCNPT